MLSKPRVEIVLLLLQLPLGLDPLLDGGRVGAQPVQLPGFFIACSVNAIRLDRHRAAVAWLVGGLVVALGYPLAKFLEIRWNLAHGIDGSSGIFFTVYYYLTFNHLVHATWGILGILWVLARLLFHGYTAEEHSGLEALASYWHATDIIWLIIFPLFYVLA